MAITPLLRSIWMADSAVKDPMTGKVTLVGLFDVIEGGVVPDLFDWPCCVFFNLAGLHGPTKLRLCYADQETGAVLTQVTMTITGDNPLVSTDVKVPLPGLPIPRDGTYAWELYHGFDLLGSAFVTARQGRQPAGEDSHVS